jgi:hypothetical protein
MRTSLRSLLAFLPLLIAFQVGCDALKGASDKAKKEEKEETEEDDDSDKKKKKKKKKDGDEAGSATAAASGTGAPTAGGAAVDAPPLIDGPAPDKKKFAAFLKDEKAKMTADIFETGLLMLADCRLETHGIDYQCDSYKDYQKGLGHPSDLDDYKKRAEVALKYIRHKSPTVRYEAVRRASSGIGLASNEASLKPILVACKAETEPQVSSSCVDSIGHAAKDKPEVKDFVFASLDHADDRVRDRAAQVLGSRLNQPIPGSYEKLADKVENDSTKKVKASACRALSAPEDPRALEIFEKLLESKKTDDEVRNACFEGLVRLWVGYSYPKKPNEKAYTLTMELLKKKPRTDKNPPTSLMELGNAKTEFKDYDRAGKDWYKDAKSFYKKEDLVKVLEEIAVDADANSGARSSALYAMKSLGAKAQLTAVAAKLKTMKDSSSKYLSETATRLSKEKD